MQDIRGELKTYQKRDIAMQYLNLALREYVKGQNMIAVIHLAGAAEEMLGNIVSLNKKENALGLVQRLKCSWFIIAGKDTPSIKDINKHVLKIKNGIKHIDNADDLEIEFDIKREAMEIIRRAIGSFNQIPELQESEELLAYYENERT